ncbi:PIN domain nuclease, a component of toxin-antitoxin system (PIN domain) [Candidatus Electrothrix aarhusensis]|uniref:PIN domain nuclease, a component of toxin-antitoxin system (PIN domain) n=1 Tax=Candidatus Electrothrix aarhusensis TaxID=1859131 RepID=A0A3S3QGU1_9BACT|nr:PIN domain nuclease, a component of toxin-antitoxin system (PIN domain) [Candidatus Electrothrix aarhusensis]
MIVLDTHAWIWWISNPEKLGIAATSAIEQAMEENGIFLSSISTWEIALLVAKGRLTLSINVRDWVRKTESLPFIRFMPVDNTIALRSVDLPGAFHADPADRIIAATALSTGLPLVTKDEKIQACSFIQTIWD